MNNKSQISMYLKPILSIGMLLLYLGVFLFVPLLENKHDHNHSHAEHQCTDENEIDPCHRLIYHNDVSQGCQHNEHFLAEIDACDLCDLIVTSNQKILFESDELNHFGQALNLLLGTKSFHNNFDCYSQSTRAPPIFIAA